MNDSPNIQHKATITGNYSEPVTMPESAESPEMELLGSLEAAGATFPKGTWKLMTAIVSGWLETHCDSPRGPRTVFDQRYIASRILKILIDETDMEQAGLKAHCLALELKLSPYKTAKELADRLGLSEGRVSQVRKALKSALLVKPLETLNETPPEGAPN